MKSLRYQFLAVAVLGAAFLLLSCQKKSAPKSGEAVVDSVSSADGTTIVYQTKGVGAPALIFVHGFGCDREFWKNQVDFFAEKVQVVTLDLAGHGQSGKNRRDWTLDNFGNDVAAVVNKLNLKQVVLIGHSMGGEVILAAAKKLPEKTIGLVGVDTFQDLSKRVEPTQVDSIVVLLKKDFPGTMTGWVREMLPANTDSSLVAWITAKATSMDPDIAVAVLQNMPDWDAAALVKDLKIPIVAINSDLRPTKEEGNKKLVPSFEVVMMKGLGHYIMLEDPQNFNLNLFDVVRDMAMAGHAAQR